MVKAIASSRPQAVTALLLIRAAPAPGLAGRAPHVFAGAAPGFGIGLAQLWRRSLSGRA